MNISKLVAVVLTGLLLANLVLFALGKLPALAFWIIIIISAAAAFWLLPKYNKRKNR